ncbi:uncharacterized protein LOC113294106 [Papaver somniferum]|uniref:uncharacterized protein LOC113294106 n=1 Tax=Papaver somniferum TaxID=3469 RepID=UPI000E704CAC|nr:uncharacterized protein LOC113294106 [Papaver somniferum]
MSSVAAFIETIGDPANFGDEEDTRSWIGGTNGDFSVSSCYEMIDVQLQQQGQAQERQRKIPSKYVWNSAIPPKVSFLVWAAAMNGLPTVDRLLRRGMAITNINCCLCHQEPETISHIFIHCVFAKKLWEHFLNLLESRWRPPDSCMELLISWQLKLNIEPIEFLKFCLPFALWQQIWKERNERIFRNKEKSVERIILQVKASLFSWASVHISFKHFKFADFIHDWRAFKR